MSKWKKSSRCESHNCVEVAVPNWHKAKASAGNGACVEVATNQPRVGVRDSKLADSPELWFTPAAWSAFLADIPSRH